MYMHSLRLVHGDLKGVNFSPAEFQPVSHFSTKANILVNHDRRACVADFGLSTITGVRIRSTTSDPDTASHSSIPQNASLMSFTSGGTTRWMSPELLDPERFGVPESEGDRPTRQSDCYALGMVIYEVGSSTDRSVGTGIQLTPRCCADTSHTTTSQRTPWSWGQSWRGFDRGNRRTRNALGSPKSCGKLSGSAGWKIAVHVQARKSSIPA